MSINPFDDLNSLAPSQNYSQQNPFDDIYEQENKEREKKLKQILNTVSSLNPDNTGEAQKLAERLNLPPGVALNSDTTLEILRERNKRQNIYRLDLLVYKIFLRMLDKDGKKVGYKLNRVN